MKAIDEKLFSVEFNNKKYSKGKWDALISSLLFGNNYIKLKYLYEKIDINYLYNKYQRNVKKYSFLGLILPCFMFLSLSLIIGYIVITSQEKPLFPLFLSVVFLFLSLGLAYKIFIKKQKCIFVKAGSRYKYEHINAKEYYNNLKVFIKVMKQEYNYFKPLETERLIIREFKIFDNNDLFEMLNSEDVNKYLLSNPINEIEKINNLIKGSTSDYRKRNIFRLAVELKDEEKVIGYIGLSKQDLTEESCQIVYAFNENYWSKGYTTEAVKAFIPYLKAIGKKVIIGGHVEDNINSGKVLLKCGFTRKPQLDHQMNIHGESKNIKIYTIEERNKNI